MRRPYLPSAFNLNYLNIDRNALIHPHHLLHRIPLFRIFYSTTFLFASLILAALLLITPGDHIYQAFKKSQVYHVIVVAGVYILTFIISLVVYAGRLFATRSALAGMPREARFGSNPHVASDGIGGVKMGGEGARDRGKESRMRLGCKVPRQVSWLVRRGLGRSALVAFQGHPRDLSTDISFKREIPVMRRKRRRKLGTLKETDGTVTPTNADAEPIWGHVSHTGWAPPESKDLPNLHYEPVVLELSNLVEAKAVSLAPIDPLFEAERTAEGAEDEEPMPDPLVVNLLQRPVSMGLRDYMAHLATLGIIPSDLGMDFLALYERARFSGQAMREDQFRSLMTMFAAILHGMQPVAGDIVDELRVAAEADVGGEGLDDSYQYYNAALDHAENNVGGDVHSVVSNETVNHTPQPATYGNPSSSSNDAASLSSSTSSGLFTTHTAPTSRPPATRLASGASNGSRIRQQAPSLRTVRSHTTTSTRSMSRSDAGSVIRLAEARTPLDLPYEFIGDGFGGSG